MNTFTPRDLDCISDFVFYVPLFFYAVSSYKSTKQKGFILLGFAAILGVMTSPMPFHRVISGHSSNAPLLFAFVHLLDIIKNLLLVFGTVKLMQDYCKLAGGSKTVLPTDAGDLPQEK